MLQFNDGTTYAEASKILERENLDYRRLYRAFELTCDVSVPSEQHEIITEKLKQNKVIDDLIPQKVTNEIRVLFVLGINREDANKVLQQEGLEVKDCHTTSTNLLVTTPIGKEQLYIDKLKQSSIVKYAEHDPVMSIEGF